MDRDKQGGRLPWWRGARGEWYVVAQLALMALVLFGPRTWGGLPVWPASPATLTIGILLMLVGAAFLFGGAFRLGPSLTPLPYPRESGKLIETGPYRFVRHPIYAGGIVLAYGWALVVHGWLTLVYATVLLIFVEIKSTREERWLTEKFPEYGEYRRRVRKLIPFIH
jgi:protein-S-isoprenylcysteine O-methyltransferase Ste14